MLKFALNGCGRMARAVAKAADSRAGFSLQAVVGPTAPDWDFAPTWVASLEDLESVPDLLIDFSLPDGTRQAAEWCERHQVALLSGVTGLPSGVMDQLQQAAQRVPVLWAANLSLGVNLLALLVGTAASVLDNETPVRIEDVHHQWKKDAPSGTSLMLGEAVAAGRDGDARAIDYASERTGEVVGDHRVRFELSGEILEFAHRARDRGIFAEGALNAASWLSGQQPGFYSARDWLAGLVALDKAGSLR